MKSVYANPYIQLNKRTPPPRYTSLCVHHMLYNIPDDPNKEMWGDIFDSFIKINSLK